MRAFRGATAHEVIAVRLDPGEAVRPALARAAQEMQLAAAAILTAYGSVDPIALEVPLTGTTPPAIFPIEEAGPAQIVAAQGIVASGSVEATLSVARRNETLSGRLLDGTRVRFGAVFVLLRVGGVRWSFVVDPDSGMPQFDAHAAGAPTQSVMLGGRPVDPAAVALVPPALIRRYGALPIARTTDTLIVAMADPNNPFAIDELRRRTGLRVQAIGVDPRELIRAIEQLLA